MVLKHSFEHSLFSRLKKINMSSDIRYRFGQNQLKYVAKKTKKNKTETASEYSTQIQF